MHVCVYVCRNVCTYVRMYVRMYVRLYVGMYVGMHACIVVVVFVVDNIVVDCGGGDVGGGGVGFVVWGMCPLLAPSCSFMVLDMSFCVCVGYLRMFSFWCVCLLVWLCGRLCVGKSVHMYGVLLLVSVSKCLSNYPHVWLYLSVSVCIWWFLVSQMPRHDNQGRAQARK